MKITKLYPSLAVKDPTEQLKFFKDAGYKIIHENKDVLEKGSIETTLEADNGQRIDIISTSKFEKEKHAIRMNVDDFDEALERFDKNHFNIILGPQATDSYKICVLESDIDTYIVLYQHLK